MGIIINNKKILGTEPSVNPGDLGLFAGVDDQFYVKKSDGTIYPIGSSISIATQSLLGYIPDLNALNQYVFGGTGTYSEFTTAKFTTQSIIVENQYLQSGVNRIGNGETQSFISYIGNILVDFTGGANPVDRSNMQFYYEEGGPLNSLDITYRYKSSLQLAEFSLSYEFIEMATHSTYRYGHYFSVIELNGQIGGAIELGFDGVTVDLQQGSNTIFTQNLP